MADLSFDDLIPQAPAAPAAPADALSFDDLIPQAPGQPQQAPVSPMAGALMATQPQLPNRTAGQWVTDIGGNVGRSAYNAFDSIAGLGDIATGGKVTPWLVEHGMDSKAARAVLDAEMSPQARAERDEVQNAQGFGPTVKALLQNPAYAGGQVIESVGPMALGGVAGKGAALGARAAGLNAGRAAVVGAGTGEGLTAAGGQAANTVQQTGGLTPKQTAAALTAGGLTGLIGAGSAGLAGRLGAADLDALLSGATGPAAGRSMLARLGIGTGLEAGEETLQSSQEQVMQNAALGNPLTQGVGNAAGQGAVLGGVMGAAGGLRRPAPQPVPAPMPAQQQQGQAAPAFTPQAMPTPDSVPSAAPVAPQAPTAPTPFAKSADINPLFDNLGVQGEQRAQSIELLRPAEADVEARRRGVLPLSEQRRLASLIGLQGSPALKFAGKIGKAYNAEEIIAMTDDVSGRLESVLKQQQQITSGNATDIQKAEFMQSVTDLQNAFGTLAAGRAESGRSLAAQRRRMFDYHQAQNIVEGTGGFKSADDLALALSKAMQSGGVANLSKMIANRKPGLWDYYYRAALLSGVRTHAVNVLSNSMTLGNEIIERGIAAGVGGIKRAFTGGRSGETLFAEPLDLLIGSAKGMTKAGVAAYDAFKTGESAMLGVGKQESGVGIRPTQGPVEKAFSLPYRALGAEDAWFATLNYEGELRTLARHQAVAERKSGALSPDMKLSQRIEQLVTDPTPSMIEKAGDHARTNTFNSKAGAFAQSIMAAKAKHPWLNIIAPFVRTPANIVKFGLKRTPLELASLVVPSWESDLKAGGAKQERAIARVLWGTSVMIGAGALASAGYVTGAGPTEEKEKRALLATGWKPYSIRTSDGTYYAYNRLDPFAMWLGLASDLATTRYKDKDAFKVGAGLLGSFVNNTINKTYLSGLSDFSEFLSDPSRNAEWYLKKTGATLTQPFTLLSNIASENDPYARESDSFGDAVKYRLPGLRNEVPAKLDQWGQPVPNIHYAGGPSSIANPISSSTETADRTVLEAGRLGWAPPKHIEQITSNKHEHVLTSEQRDELAQVVGALIHQEASQLMRSKGYLAMDDDQKRQVLSKIADKARSRARLAYLPVLARGNRRDFEKLRNTTGGGK
jgi:hypothetical protein